MHHYTSTIWSACGCAHLVVDLVNQKAWWCLSSDYYAMTSIEQFENIKLSVETKDELAHGSPWQEISFDAATAMINSEEMFEPVKLDDDDDAYNWIT